MANIQHEFCHGLERGDAPVTERKMSAKLIVTRCLCIALLVTALVAVSRTQASAAGSMEIDIPYEHLWFNYSDRDVDDTFTYQIVGATETTPMPEGSVDGVYYFDIEGNATGTLNLRFPYDHVGEYSYFVSAYVPDPQPGYTYEPHTYLISIYLRKTNDVLTVYALTIQDELLRKYDELPLDPSYREFGGITVEIPYHHEFHNDTGEEVDATFYYQLTPVTPDAPMPDGTEDDVYIFSVTGSVEDMLHLDIEFTEEGTYIYQVRSYVDNAEEGYTYEDTVYTIEIRIVKTVDGLVLETIIIRDDEGNVLDHIAMLKPAYHKPEEEPTPTPTPTPTPKPVEPKTGDDNKMGVWLTVMGVSAVLTIGIVLVLTNGRRHRDD